jgi:AraC-like DNA-binding protein
MEGAVREALAYRLWNEVEIFVVGSDSWSSLPDILADLVARPAKGSLASRLTALPANLANAMLMAAEHPADWPLKRILAEAGTSRSTLERRLQELGLPSPGALLRYFAHDARRRA